MLNSRGDCVGIAFQSLTGDVQSIGYVIPASVCRHFLEDVHRHGIYTGFPSLNVGWQEMESKALKHAYKLGPHEKGILIRRVSEAIYDGELQTDDIILSIDGVDVGSDGTVPFRHGERLDFNFLITNHFVGDCAELIIMRGMERKQLKVKLQPYQHLVPPHIAEQKPSYFMCGGLVFTACSDPYLLQRYGALNSSPVRLLERAYFGTKSRMEEELVVLSNVLACQATLGYDATQGLRDSAVVAFNGQKVRNLVHLARMVSSCEDEFLKFDMEAGKKFIILERVLANQCTMEVIENHNMRASMSSNVEAALIERPKLDKS